MSLLINNDLIWLSIPKCASKSIETALLNSNLNISKHKYLITNSNKHIHLTLSELYHEFGKKETICIKRDWFERWISGLQWIFTFLNNNLYFNPIIDFENIDNNFIYNTFDDKFIYNLYHGNIIDWETNCKKLMVKNNIKFNNSIKPDFGFISVLCSPNYFKENVECTYEFDLNNINEFKNFLENRFNCKLNIPHIHISQLKNNKIIINDELKNFIWDNFEKPYEKINKLI